MKRLTDAMRRSPLHKLFAVLSDGVVLLQYHGLSLLWRLQGHKRPSADEVKAVCENVTFLYKSFQRQHMAKRLYRNIQRFYPGARVVIADDSQKPLDLTDDSLTVIQLPFNSGLSAGLQRGLEAVTTPFVMRMDDDELLTPFTQIGRQLRFLQEHAEIDLVGMMHRVAPRMHTAAFMKQEYDKHAMLNAPRPLLIPHLTRIDDTHTVYGKVPNIFLARTDKVKEVGYDENIRVIDHHEFFLRAAGVLVSVLDESSWVYHYHNRFDRQYHAYRGNIKQDVLYIRQKHNIR